MGLVLQVIATGIAIGSVYGLLAISLTLIYRLSGVVHLALGELANLTMFGTLLIVFGQDLSAHAHFPLPRFLIGAAVSLLATGASGAAVYIVAVKPFLRESNDFAWIGGIVAAAITLRGVLTWLFVKETYVLPDPIPVERLPSNGVLDLGGGASLQVRALIVATAALVLATVGTYLLNHSRWGRGLRAATQDRVGAALAGVNVQRILLVLFALSAFVAGAAALIALPGTPLSVNTGTLLGLKGLVAAVAVRFGPPRRVFIAAIGLGVLETAIANTSIGTTNLAPALGDIVPLALVLLVLAFKPFDRPRDAMQ